MLQYGLNQKDKEQLEIPGYLPSGFGRRNEDYIHIYVYQSEDLTTDEDDVLVGDEIFMSMENNTGFMVGEQIKIMITDVCLIFPEMVIKNVNYPAIFISIALF